MKLPKQLARHKRAAARFVLPLAMAALCSHAAAGLSELQFEKLCASHLPSHRIEVSFSAGERADASVQRLIAQPLTLSHPKTQSKCARVHLIAQVKAPIACHTPALQDVVTRSVADLLRDNIVYGDDGELRDQLNAFAGADLRGFLQARVSEAVAAGACHHP